MNGYDEIVKSIPMVASTPSRSDLCLISCEIDLLEVQDSSAQSNFHWQTMKCRLLIFQISEVIAAPAPTVRKPFSFFPQCQHEKEPIYINVITTKIFFETGELQSYLRRYNLAYGSPQPVSVEIYKSCIDYTIQCKIAPEWIRIGQHLLRDVNFCSSVNEIDTIKLNIAIEDSSEEGEAEKARFEILARKAKISFLDLDDFYLPPPLVAEFNADPKGRIDFTKPYYCQFSLWVHVLPSMKKGKIVSVSKEIPKMCPFKDYAQLRRHWRNMYGYRLPKTPESILYYEIHFPIPQQRDSRFTYPGCCLTPKPLDFYTCKDSYTIITEFVQHVKKEVPQICDAPLQISRWIRTQNLQPSGVSKTGGLSVRSIERVSLPRNWFKIDDNSQPSQETTPRMEFSAKYPNPFYKARGATQKSQLTPCLSMVQQIHSSNTLAADKYKPPSNNDLAKPSTSAQAANTEIISSYFKERKPRSKPYDRTAGQLSLKEKIMSNMTYKPMGSTMEHDPVTKMARESRLNELTKDVMKSWLRQRSIPHTKHDRKSDLITKISSHIQNTQPL